MRLLTAIAAACLLLPPQQATFKARVNFVEVDAVVTGADGAFVRGLSRGDFEILENGERQDVTVASLVDLPIDLTTVARGPAPARAVPPDVVSNVQAIEGRLYLLALDEMHVDPSRTPMLRRRAREFVEQYVQAGDRVAVAHIGYPTLNQEFTTNKALALASIEKFIGEKMESAAVAAANAFDSGSAHVEKARGIMSERTVQALAALSSYLTSVHGRRKAMVFFSEGLDVDVMTGSGSGMEDGMRLLDELRNLYSSAARANVNISSVDPRGAATMGGDELIKVGICCASSEPARAPAGMAIYSELKVAQQSLRNLAEVTGGLAAVASNDFAQAFTRIVEDNSTYYLLGYNSTNAALDGKFRKLSVRVNRPGVQVRARSGYYSETLASAAKPPTDAIADLLTSPLATTGLPMSLGAGALQGSGKRALIHVTAEIDGRDVAFDQDAGAFVNDLELVYQAVDGNGEIKARHVDTVKLRLQQGVHAAVAAKGLRYQTEFELDPGRYQIRVAGRERVGGHAGSVYIDLEVPDLSKSALALSSLFLTSRDAGAMPSAAPAGVLKDRLPGPVTTARTFKAGETLAVFAQVIDHDEHLHAVSIATSVTSIDGKEVFHAAEVREAEALAKDAGILTAIPTEGWPPGDYVLTIEAASSAADRKPVSRAIGFHIQ